MLNAHALPRVCVALILIVLVGCAPPPRSDDHLSPTLRAEVEQLKRDVAANPTTNETASARARVLFDWVNAWALHGGYVPVNATAVVSQINAYGIPAGPALDDFIAELSLHDEQPDAIGEFHAQPLGPFVVRQYATFSQIYTVGEAPVRDGGGFLIAKHFQANHPPFQVQKPAGANYVSISSTNPNVRFTEDRVQVSGMHGGFRGAEDQLAFRVRGGTLQPGDVVTIVYGDTSGGGPGLKMPDFKSDQMPFPVYLDLDGSGLWLSLPIQPIRTIGDAVASVAGFAPSVVGIGEQIEVSMRAEDAYGNRATGKIPDWVVFDGDAPVANVTSTREAVITTSLVFDKPGVHRLSIKDTSGAIEGLVNPILVEAAPDQRIYWGDTHGHSGFAEGIGTAEAYMKFARDDARLDFVTHSEHDIWMDDSEWETLRRLVSQYTEDGRFVAYLGYEWTVRQSQGGHHNVLFRTPEGRNRVPSQFYPLLSSLYQGLRTGNETKDVLVIPHAHQKGDYRYSDPEMETLVEIMSMHGTFEWFGRMYLSHGHEVGFVAASDDHIGRPGYAQPKSTSLGQRGGLGAVYARARTTDGIFDALKSLRTYATTGDRIVMQFAVNGSPMGTRAAPSANRDIEGRVIGTAPMRSVRLMKNDEILKEWQYLETRENELAISFYSESYPYHPEDNPRGWRHWRGTLEVIDGELSSAELVDLQNPSVQGLTVDPDDPNRIHFATMTRGDHSTLRLSFNKLASNTRFRITLEDATETGGGPPLLRRHQTIKGGEFMLTLGNDEEARLPMTFDGYNDAIVLSKGTTAPMQVSVSLTDDTHTRHGDYYYMQVRQLNEALAWSSPVWVGGSSPR